MTPQLTAKRAPHEIPVRFVAHDRNWSDALEAYVRQQMSSTFCRFGNRIFGTVVSLRDINGPRGGIDKRCRVRLRLLSKGQITVSADAASAFAAAATAISRAHDSLVRKLERRIRRRPGRRSTAVIYEDIPMERRANRIRNREERSVLNSNVAGIGSTVVVRELAANEIESYTLVNADDADIQNYRISTFSPAGRAFYGRRAGDVVTVAAPGGRFRYRIENVHDGHLDASADHYGRMLNWAES